MSWRRVLVSIAGLLGIAIVVSMVVFLFVVLPSEWFRERLRQTLISRAYAATGGKLTFQSLTIDPRRLEFRISGIVFRGTEPIDHRPLFSAERLELKLRLVSWVRRDFNVEWIRLEKPEFSLQVAEDGTTNLPRPPRPVARQDVIQILLRLAARRFETQKGAFYLNDRRFDLDLEARELVVQARYDWKSNAYWGEVRSGPVRLMALKSSWPAIALSARWQLRQGAIDLPAFLVKLPAGSQITGQGTVALYPSTVARMNVSARLLARDLAGRLQFPYRLGDRGEIDYQGSVILGGEERYQLAGSLAAQDLRIQAGQLQIPVARASAQVRLRPAELSWQQLEARLYGGKLQGEGQLSNWKELVFRGRLQNARLDAIARAAGYRTLPWTGLVSARFDIRPDRLGNPSGWASVYIQPQGPGIPLFAHLELGLDFARQQVQLRSAKMSWATTGIEAQATGKDQIRWALQSSDLQDLKPAAELLGFGWADLNQVKLAAAPIQAEGSLAGLSDKPVISARLRVGTVQIDRWQLGNVTIEAELNPHYLAIRQVRAEWAGGKLAGRLGMELHRYRPTRLSQLTGSLRLDGVELAAASQPLDWKSPVEGTLYGSLKFSGTYEKPDVRATLEARKPAWGQDRFERLWVEARATKGELEILQARLSSKAGELTLSGYYRFGTSDPRTGRLEVRLDVPKWRLSGLQVFRQTAPELDGIARGNARFTLELTNGQPRLDNLQGEAAVSEITLRGRKIGQAVLEAGTGRRILRLVASAKLGETVTKALAEWSLSGDNLGLGQLEFQGLTLETLQALGLFGGGQATPPARVVMDGEIGFSGPIMEPKKWRGVARVSRFELVPTSSEGRPWPELTLRNDGPWLFEIEPARLRVESARLVSERANVEVDGVVAFDRKRPWNVHASGKVDLGALQYWNPDLKASGIAQLDVTVRGPLLQPEVTGKLVFSGASFYLANLPMGLSEATGVVRFDRSRAYLEKFTANAGGGTLQLSGSLSFAGGQWVYQLHAEGKSIRIRYPESVSTVLDASLDLTGSSQRSLLSGEVTIQRAAADPNLDVASLLSRLGRTSPPGTVMHPFLAGMQFDVRVRTGGEAEVLTSLTRDVGVEADLRLRGGPSRPVLLGRVTIHRGEIIFLGNKYSIARGEIRFFNPARIEPVVAMDLETRIRGYTVSISFSGPINRLSFSYRSDPPLQLQEILALLTVGRPPAETTVRASDSGSLSFLEAGANSLISQALATPISQRLQRLFGVSRIKIDPKLSGLDNTPETYLTVEQQLSRDITVTYVTNLSRTQQQVVRVEWNFSPNWSLLAVRDSNGVFGVDFLYRRSLR